MNKEVLNKSIFLVGPAGCGKSLHSRRLGEKTNLPVITMDNLRHCPRSIEFLESECERLDLAIMANRALLENSVGIEKEELMAKRRYLIDMHSKRSDQLRMRRLLPNLPNYNDIALTIHTGKGAGMYRMGFNDTMAEGIRDIAQSHGFNPNIAWHNYQKPFEIALVQNLIEQLDFPAIIDFGGGMPISLERGYNSMEQRAFALGITEEEYREVIPFDGETLTRETMYTFNALPSSQVVYFKAPEDLYQNPEKYRENRGMKRLLADKLNPEFIGAQQYEAVSGVSIYTENALAGSEINFEAVEENCDQIISQTKTKAQSQDEGQNMQ